MLKELIKIANRLDQKGLRKEADHLDFIIRKLAQADDFQLTFINDIDVENKDIYSEEYSDEIFSQIPNSGNLRLRFKDGLGNRFDALVEFDKIGSTHMDDMNNIILFSTESTDAAMEYAKQQALGIYSYKNETKQFDSFSDEDEDEFDPYFIPS